MASRDDVVIRVEAKVDKALAGMKRVEADRLHEIDRGLQISGVLEE